MFSQLPNLRPWTSEKEHRYEEAKTHMELVAELYLMQIQEGRISLHDPRGNEGAGKEK